MPWRQFLHDYQSPSFPVNQFIRQGLKIHFLNYPASTTCIDKGNLVINQRPYLSMLTKYLCAVILTMKGNVKQSPYTFSCKLYYWDQTCWKEINLKQCHRINHRITVIDHVDNEAIFELILKHKRRLNSQQAWPSLTFTIFMHH